MTPLKGVCLSTCTNAHGRTIKKCWRWSDRRDKQVYIFKVRKSNAAWSQNLLSLFESLVLDGSLFSIKTTEEWPEHWLILIKPGMIRESSLQLSIILGISAKLWSRKIRCERATVSGRCSKPDRPTVAEGRLGELTDRSVVRTGSKARGPQQFASKGGVGSSLDKSDFI